MKRQHLPEMPREIDATEVIRKQWESDFSILRKAEAKLDKYILLEKTISLLHKNIKENYYEGSVTLDYVFFNSSAIETALDILREEGYVIFEQSKHTFTIFWNLGNE